MTDRDPIDQTPVAIAASTWLRVLRTIGVTPAMRDEADIAFEEVLLTQGVLAPDDIVKSIRSRDADTVAVILADGMALAIDAAFGDVTAEDD